ncbi:MAG TPA: glycoside hydrolase family 2 TIM barrel-domain containing protein [Kribbella sp.]
MRQRTNLNRDWTFALGDHAGAEAEDFDDSDWRQAGLPHSFSTPYFQEPEFYIGPGWYRRLLVLDRRQLAGVVGLDFEGAFQVADVYLNGVLVGRHEGGYTGFAFEVQDVAREGDNLLAVRVDNTWNPRIAPLGGEHVFSGGLYRDVWLDTTGPLHVDWYGTKVTTSGIDDHQPRVTIETEVRNSANAVLRGRLSTTVLAPDGTVIAELLTDEEDYPSGVTTRTQTTAVLDDVRLWSPDQPVLYRVVSVLLGADGVSDRYETTFGFRSIAWTADQGFFLNGKHHYIRGVNVHQDQAGWGDAVTNRSIRRDLELVKQAGFEFVRGSHYPHDPAFTSYADELGLLVWSEGPFWGTAPFGHLPWGRGAYPVEPEHWERFEANLKTQLTEMIRINRNSPSVVAWSTGNEVFFSDPAVMDRVRKLVTGLVDLVHELDPTRPAAVGGVQRGELDHLGDIAGYNGDGAWMFPDPGIANIVSEYGSAMEHRPGAYGPQWGDLAHQEQAGETSPYPWRHPWRSGEVRWCGFDHGSIAGPRFGSMGMIDYARLPKRAWYWYRNDAYGIEPPSWPEPADPVRLLLSADRTVLERADGTDDLHIVATLADADGQQVSSSAPITLVIEDGPGEFATGRRITFTAAGPATVLDGQAAAFFRSYHCGTTRISGTSPGLETAWLEVVTVDGPALQGPNPVPLDRTAPPPSPPLVVDPLNLFGRHTPTRSSTGLPGHPSMHVNDGSTFTYWAAATTDDDPWVLVDLERLVAVERVDVTFHEPDNAPEYVVEASDDRRRWHLVAEHSAATTHMGTHRIPARGVTALQVRVRIRPTQGSTAAIADLSVRGVADTSR